MTAIQPVDLEPAYLAERTYATRRRRFLIDITALVNFMVATLFLLPARLVIPALPAVGRPALMLGLLVAAIWAISKLHPQYAMRGPQPMRWAAAVFLVAALLSYAAGYLRGLPTLEANGADLALIATVIFVGIILVVSDCVPNRERLDALVRTIVWCGAAMALIGLASFAIRIDLTAYIQIPGLVLHADLSGLEARGWGFVRVASTATHYIEFSTVMAMILPFAIHLVRYGRTRVVRQHALISTVLIAAAIPVALSRTGILAIAVGLLCMFFAWNWRTRLNVAGMGIAVLAGIMLVEPGLLGTIRSLFLNMQNDPSIEGRTQDWDIMMAYFAERPWLGRGMGTFVPDLYIVVDNQWLQQLVGGGLIGVAALLALHIAGFTVAMLARARSTSAEYRHLCACIATVQPVAIVVGTAFDSFAFTTFIATLALITGMSGTIWRLTHPDRQVRASRTAGVPAA